ncbi:putative mitochondrial protein [Tanacetum coccineum]
MVNTRTNSLPLPVTLEYLYEAINEIKNAFTTLSGQVNDQAIQLRLVQTEFTRITNVEGTSSGTNDRNGMGRQGNNQMRHYGRMDKIEFPNSLVERCERNGSLDMVNACPWELYKQEALRRLGAAFEELMVDLKNLKQTSTVQAYQDQFESLLNKVELLESYAVSLFVGRLKGCESALPIRMFRLNHIGLIAFAIARMQEATNIEMKPRYSPFNTSYKSNNFGGGYKSTRLLPNLTTAPLALPAPNQSTSGTRGERECGEKQPLQILVDSGSTHNFVDIRSARKLGCKIRPTAPLLLSMANGQEIISSYECRPFNWSIQGQNYSCDAMLLPLGGCEMVLEVQWLSTLGDIKWNFRNLTMKFELMGKRIILRGTKQTTLQWMQGNNV